LKDIQSIKYPFRAFPNLFFKIESLFRTFSVQFKQQKKPNYLIINS